MVNEIDHGVVLNVCMIASNTQLGFLLLVCTVVDYRNLRPKYVDAVWGIINWDTVEKRLVDATA